MGHMYIETPYIHIYTYIYIYIYMCVYRVSQYIYIYIYNSKHIVSGHYPDIIGGSLKLLNKFTYTRSSIFSKESDIDKRLAKAWSPIDKLLVIWKSNNSDKIKSNFFQAVVVSILLYGCTVWMLTMRIKKKLDVNCTRMIQVILNKPWKQHSRQQQLYGQLPSIFKTIQIRRTCRTLLGK